MTVKKVRIGQCELGNGKIYIQSMLNIPADDIAGNVRQAKELEQAGCEIVRVSVPRPENVKLIEVIKNEINIINNIKISYPTTVLQFFLNLYSLVFHHI